MLLQNEKHLIFCGSINQAKEVCEHSFHSESEGDELDRFNNGEFLRLSCVDAISRAVSVNGIQSGIIGKLNSKDKHFIQKNGRLLRRKDGKPSNMFVIYHSDTQDEKWLQANLQEFNKEKISFL